MVDAKPCRVCGALKPLTEFYPNAGMRDGHLNMCRACSVVATAEWRNRSPGCRAAEYARSPQAAEIARRGRRKRPNGTGKDPESRRRAGLKYQQKRYAAERARPPTEFDELVLDEARRLRQHRERVIGSRWHIDHIVPLHHPLASGLHNGHNVQVVPASWNQRKNNTTMQVFWEMAA